MAEATVHLVELAVEPLVDGVDLSGKTFLELGQTGQPILQRGNLAYRPGYENKNDDHADCEGKRDDVQEHGDAGRNTGLFHQRSEDWGAPRLVRAVSRP